MADEKIKEVERPKIPEKIQEAYKPKKEEPSTFDKVLERNRLLQESPRTTQTTAQEGSKEGTRVARQEDQSDRGKDSKSDEREKERGKEKAKEDRQGSGVTEQRIVGKGTKKESSGQGGGKGSDDRGYGSAAYKKTIQSTKKSEHAKGAEAALENAKFATHMKAQMKAAHLSGENIQKMVDQMIKFVRSGLNRDGEHEVRLDLHEKIFKGLQLRVAMKNGKVSVHFNTANAEVRGIFERSSDAIKKQLESKGMSVTDIRVT